LPDRAPRSVRLRQSRGADSRGHHRRRPKDQSARLNHEAVVRVRARSHKRQTGMADRGASGAAVGRARREDVADAAVSDAAAGLPKETNRRYRAGDRRLIQLPNGLPLTKPPYGRITAIDLNRGEQVWMAPNGDGPRTHPLLKSLNLPPLGQAVRAAPLVTKTLLFVTEGDQINVRTPPGGGGRKIRAYDKATGAVVWEQEMDAGSTGTLMTYLYRGRQYLVVAIGGQNHPAEFVAFALAK